MRMILGSTGGWARTRRLMKLPPRVVLTDAQPHRLDHVCIVFDSDCTWSVRALTLKSRAFCARASFLTDARRLASSPLIRVRGGSAGKLEGFGGRGAVMVETLGLVGEESFATIGANGKWQRRRSGV